MPLIALGCCILVAILVKVKNFALEYYEDKKGLPLSPPTEIDALYGLLFASFYYLYLQVGFLQHPCFKPTRTCAWVMSGE